ncbi:GT2 family glycosyltransferase [Actinomadura coerulea]|uniref:GT2 family glycosyltransferase n=1 Tax=Actinomadura coerulea TaxID=46159 RepID=A0A7X0FW27_9ACTN|nr:glycosyltransferase family A protein [Actinomadura coerulea]MBB6394768.1 GT2 family glycosyltransferase [Actinomadura coerulea]GGQ32147.1 glycosyl transferase [Actinomadura coerulea]
MPDVTIVVATRDRAPELRRSLGHHTAPVIVVDNASGDGTAAVAEAAGATVLRLPSNRGAAARNAGAQLADTRYIAFADDDSWWAPGSLERAARILDAHPGTALLAAKVLVGEEERVDPVSERMARSELGRPEGLPGPAVLGFLACSVVMRRDAFLDAGGFSDVLHFGGEEELLALDLAAAGWGLAYAPELAVHHHPSGTGRDPAARRRRQARNRVLTAWLRRPLPAVARTAASALASREGRAGLADAARALPALARARRPVPPAVEAARTRLAGY